MRIFLTLAILTILPLSAGAQQATLSGFIRDSESAESLIGANVYAYQQQVGTAANNYGFYSLTLPADSAYIRVSYLGYVTRNLRVDLSKGDLQLDIDLAPEAVSLEGVEVIAERVEDVVESTQMSAVDIPIEKIKSLPALMGEKDIIKTIQLMPGVQSGSEGSSGLYVRGGGADQNLILLDGAPVYNASHLFGFLSVFNDDALQNATLIKGGFPARYGGRLSSVLDISMKEGNMKKYEVDGALGLISSKLTVQGPLMKDKMSFIVSGRRTYLDVLARPFVGEDGDEDFVFYLYDLNAKVNYVANDRSRFYLSYYSGKDAFGASYDDTYQSDRAPTEETFRGELNWGNATSTFRWNYLFSNKLFGNLTATYSRYKFHTGTELRQRVQSSPTREEYNEVRYDSGIRDWSGKLDFDYRPNPEHYVRFGGLITRHSFTPGIGRLRTESTGELPVVDLLTPTSSNFVGIEYAAYLEDDISFGRKLKVNLGGHFSGLSVNGVNYTSLQPRISMRYAFGSNMSWKASYSTMQQYLHLLTNAGLSLPTDLWVAATDQVKPQDAWQAATGLTHVFDGGYEVSLEGYYKEMNGLIEYKPGVSFLASNNDWQDNIETGEGWSYGGELFVQKKKGKTTGWLGYTLSWTERKFLNLNNGEVFPYRYDRRHDISLVLTHKLSDRMDLGAVWVYGTGNAVTLATSRFRGGRQQAIGYPLPSYIGSELSYFGGRNGYRMDAYHRLDFSANWHWNRALFSRKGASTLSLSVYNTYNRKNPFFLYPAFDNQGNNIYRQVSLLPILPSVAYHVHF